MNLKKFSALFYGETRGPVDFVHVVLSKRENKTIRDAAFPNIFQIGLHAFESLIRSPHAVVRFWRTVQTNRQHISTAGEHLQPPWIQQHSIGRNCGSEPDLFGVLEQSAEV